MTPPVDLDDLVASRKQRFSGRRLKLDRILNLLRTYPPQQVASRVAKLGRKRLGLRSPLASMSDDVIVSDTAAFTKLCELAEHQSVDHGDVLQGELTLLNQSHPTGWPIDWQMSANPRPSHLWRFQLHYQEWLFERRGDLDFFWATIIQWIESMPVDNPAAHDDAWHPYCISRRIPVWMKMFSSVTTENHAHVLASLFAQADFLSKNLETDLRGNHLLENLHALAMAACFFKGQTADKWRQQAVSHLRSELAFQTLPSGEHYERSPMYQCVVIGNLLQLAIVSKKVSDELHRLALDYATSMLSFLQAVLCPDGEIPLLSDSCFGEAPSVNQLKAYADEVGVLFRPAEKVTGANEIGGYWMHRSSENMLLLDAGEVAAKGLPGHAHCDLLNVLGSIDGERFLVDSGNGSYDLDATRQYCRSSVAHNVLTIDETDHADVWSKFRMGFRGHPQQFRSGTHEGFHWAAASHNAYQKLDIQTVKRVVVSHSDELFWVCLDWVVAKRGNHQLEGFLHFANSVELSRGESETEMIALHQGKKNHIGFLGTKCLLTGKGWRCEEFGSCKRNSAAIYRASVSTEALLGWCICRDGANATVRMGLGSRFHVVLNQHETSFDVKTL